MAVRGTWRDKRMPVIALNDCPHYLLRRYNAMVGPQHGELRGGWWVGCGGFQVGGRVRLGSSNPHQTTRHTKCQIIDTM